MLLAAAAGLAVMRLFPLALPSPPSASASGGAAGRSPAPGGQSEVESPALRMTLDHDSGRMEGEVTAGPYRGARLSELSPDDLDRLMAGFEAEGDDDSRALLFAWLERHGSRRDRRGPGPAPPPPMRRG